MLYVKRSDGGYATFDGMTPDQVIASLSDLGVTCTFIDKATYDAECPKFL